ncbi:CG13405 [Drosophila busckii]|uniref:CG13405 n=1 Tax=Drosophila busckii TaxID=30019 RepID=A0A0M4EPK9_DROBS|nr:uncharacterized protein LOC108599245 [Drosophila busckii]ALC44067.1 CG13405 [Drosophila busckii]
MADEENAEAVTAAVEEQPENAADGIMSPLKLMDDAASEATVGVEDEDDEDEEESDADSESDLFELLHSDSEDNEEQMQQYREYLDLTKQIDCQNAIIKDLKSQMRDLLHLPCQTRSDKLKCKQLNICLQQESLKLKTMMNRAIQLQNFGSQRWYAELELETTGLEEQLMKGNRFQGCSGLSRDAANFDCNVEDSDDECCR